MRLAAPCVYRGWPGPAAGVVPMPLIRKCEKCGSLDNRATWSSADEAAKEGAFSGWTCPTCAWTEFDLVEAETEQQPANAR